ncbi:hypothetical protein YC2023_081532 [Brassica napus]
MVLEAEKTEKLVRRRTRSRGEKQKHPSPTKDQRYPGSSARLLKKFKYSADSLHVSLDSGLNDVKMDDEISRMCDEIKQLT